VLRTEGCFADGKRALKEWFCLFITTSGIIDEAQVMQGERHIRVLQAEGCFADGKCSSESIFRFVMVTLVG
jgi:hypothetical protein